jgi:hypothetical protein
MSTRHLVFLDDNPSGLTFLGVDTRTPYLASFDGAAAGKTAHYMLRWVSATGAKGPVERNGQRDGWGVAMVPGTVVSPRVSPETRTRTGA